MINALNLEVSRDARKDDMYPQGPPGLPEKSSLLIRALALEHFGDGDRSSSMLIGRCMPQIVAHSVCLPCH